MIQTKKKIFYWAPFIVNIATPKAVINSVASINQYSSLYSAFIINFFKEYSFTINKNEINENDLLNFYKHNLIKYLPKHGFLQSRISFIFLFLLSMFPLHRLLKKKKNIFKLL